MVALLNRNDQVVDPRARGAVRPLPAVADAVDFVVESDCAALGYSGLLGERGMGVVSTNRRQRSAIDKTVLIDGPFLPQWSSARCS